MAVLATETFEPGGAIGTAVQEVDTIFSNVDNVGITYVAGLAGSSRACNVAPATTGACRHDGFTAMAKIVNRFIFKFSALPATDTIIAHLCLGNPNTTGIRIGHLYLTTTGKLVVRNGFTVVGTSVMTFAINTEYALEWMFDGGAQQQTLRMFTNTSLIASAAETIGPVAATAAATADWVQVGKMTNTTWTGGLTFDGYQRANDWVATASSNPTSWNEEFVGTDGNDITLPVGWVKEGTNTNSPKYATGGPHTDQSVLRFPAQSLGNRNLLTLQLPAGANIYERFYLQLSGKPEKLEEHEMIWSAGSVGGVRLFRLVIAPGINNLCDLQLWADEDWNPTLPPAEEGLPPNPEPIGTITGLSIDLYHRVEIHINASVGPAICTVTVWKGARRHQPGSPDGTMSGSCVGTTSLRYRRFGQTLHSSVLATEVHRSVSFDSIVSSSDGVAIGPLPLASQFEEPLNENWAAFEWNGSEEIPLTMAGASLGGATLEEVSFGTEDPDDPDDPDLPGTQLFTNDPGQGKKLYASADSNASPRYNAIADLYNFEMRTLSAGPGHPASDRCAPGCYRSFHGGQWGAINPATGQPYPMQTFSSHGASTWDESRNAAANTAISSWSFDCTNAGFAAGIYQGDYDDWLQNTLAPFIKDIYERYGHLYIFDLANEPDSGDSPAQNTPLYLARVRRAVRYIHFFLKDQCDVPEAAFMVSNGTTFAQMAANHEDAHKVPVNTTDTSWPSGRGDAIYYWIADWKGTRTVANGYWSDAYDPNPADFIQPGEMDPWNYGRGPVVRMYSTNWYDRQYEHLNTLDTLAKFRANVPSIATTAYGRIGLLFKFLKSLYGGTDPVLDVSSAGPNGIPVFIGEMGLGVWNPLPYPDNPAEPIPTADAYCEVFMKDLVEKCNVVAYAKWRYVIAAYNNQLTTASDTFSHHRKANGLSRGGGLWDPTNSNTKAEAAIFNTTYVKNPPPWPNGTQRPPHIKNATDTKRDRRGNADVTNVV